MPAECIVAIVKVERVRRRSVNDGRVECIHAASLILDDLPSMDNAPLRRGRPSAHVAHGEAVAILAAFGLINLAYGHLARAYAPPIAARITSLYSEAVGLDGLIAGQAEDVLSTDAAIDFTTLERIHRRKTGVLFGNTVGVAYQPSVIIEYSPAPEASVLTAPEAYG